MSKVTDSPRSSSDGMGARHSIGERTQNVSPVTIQRANRSASSEETAPNDTIDKTISSQDTAKTFEQLRAGSSQERLSDSDWIQDDFKSHEDFESSK